MNQLYDLRGKVALIPGGSRGIGAQIARDLAVQGADIVIASRNKQGGEELAHEITQIGRKAISLACDVSNLDQISSLFETTIQEFGQIDILINSAGTNVTKPALEVTEKEWDHILDVNLKGLFFCCQEAAKVMIPRKQGKIINISSVGGVKSYKRLGPYVSSKAGVIHLTRCLASEWARYNILVNSIAPGLISTEINEKEMADKDWLENAVKAIPLRRLGVPQDISNIALYLVSDASNYVTGQTFYIDGGTLSE